MSDREDARLAAEGICPQGAGFPGDDSQQDHRRRLQAGQKDEELEALFTLSLQMLCIAGTDGYFKRVNPAFERTLGYADNELLSRPLVEFVHPDDRETTQREIQKLAEGQATVRFENRYVCKDGSIRWFSWKAMPDRGGGRIYASASDVTEQRQAEEALRRSETRFRRLLESAPDAMVIVDRQGTIVLVNAQAERVLGYSADELTGKSVEILVPESLRAKHQGQRHAFAGAPQLRTMGSRPELSALRKDGTAFPAEISLSPIETDEGLVISCAIRDLTERKRTEAVLREQRAQLLAAERIQQHLLPHAPPALPGYDIAGAMHPAEFAAGDSFDYIALPDGSLGIVVGDVSGHGFSAALLMASTHARLRSFAETCPDVGDLLTRTNRALAREIEDDRFITLLFARLDPAGRTVSFVNAGHPPGHLLDASGRVKATLTGSSLPLGTLPEAAYRAVAPIALAPGDLLLFVTDGVLECESPGGEFFGLERTLDIVRTNQARPAGEIIDALYRAVQAHRAPKTHADDVTAVVVKVESAVPR